MHFFLVWGRTYDSCLWRVALWDGIHMYGLQPFGCRAHQLWWGFSSCWTYAFDYTQHHQKNIFYKPFMRILLLSTTGAYCGISTYTKNLAKNLEKVWDEPCVHSIPDKIDFQYFSSDEVFRFFDDFSKKARDYDVVHIQHEFGIYEAGKGYFFGVKVFARLLRRLRTQGIPVIVTFHSEPLSHRSEPLYTWRGLDQFVRSALLMIPWRFRVAPHFRKNRWAQACVHTVHSLWKFRQAGFAKKNLHLLRHGVVAQHGYKKSQNTSSKYLSQDIITLGIFGFVSEYKGYMSTLKALSLLPENFELIIIGWKSPDDLGDYLDRLMRRIQKLNLNNRVRVTWFVAQQEIASYFEKVDICLAPYNDWKLSSSGALTWALTSGKPIIASNIFAFRELNRENECLYLVQPDAPHEQAWAIQRLASDENLQATLIQEASKYIDTHSWKRLAKSHHKLYTSLFEK